MPELDERGLARLYLQTSDSLRPLMIRDYIYRDLARDQVRRHREMLHFRQNLRFENIQKMDRQSREPQEGRLPLQRNERKIYIACVVSLAEDI